MSRRNASRQGARAGFAAVLLLLVTGYAAAAPVSPPTSLTATAVSSSQINLAWADSNTNESGYFVERSLSSTTGFAQIASLAANATSYASTGLAAGTTYYYRVRAAMKNGTYSTYSNVVSARTTSPTGTVPSAPSNLAAASPSSSQITISWTDNSTNETGFKVERALAAGGPWTYIGATASTSYASTGLAAGTTYYYRVQAYNSYGNSAYSNTASATTLGGTGIPAAPGSASATTVSSSQINVGWADTSGNETGFKIERSTASAGWAQIATVGANVTSYASTGLAASTTYSFRVRAYNASGDSGYSNTASATTSSAAGGAGAHLWSTHFGSSMSSDAATPVGIAVDSTGAAVVLGYMSGHASFGGSLFTSAGGTDIYLAKYSASGAHQWSQRFGGTGTDRPKGIAVDSSGNIVITGYFGGSVSFGGTALVGSSASGFVAKYSSSGAHLWSRRLTTGTSSVDEGRAIGIDGSGNVIVGAGFNFTADFGAGSWTAGAADIVIAKYSSAGAYLWAKRFGGSSDEFIQGLAVDTTTGEIAITGYFLGSLTLGGGTIASAGGNDAFIAKYSSAGAHVWSGRWGSTAEDKGAGIDIDSLGNVAVTGLFTNSVSFGGTVLTNTGGTESADIFLVKLTPQGVHLWSKGFGASLALKEMGNSVAFDSAGNVFLTGSIVALTAPYTVDFGGGALTGDGWYNTFIAKFGSSGSYTWAKRYLAGGANSDGKAIATDSSGNVLTVGTYDASINLGGTTLSSPGGTDTYLAKFGP